MDPGAGGEPELGHPAPREAVETTLAAKAEEKRLFVQDFIRRLEVAQGGLKEEHRKWIRQLMDPEDHCFSTLVKIMVAPEYGGFVNLQCVVLRAIQMMLKMAVACAEGERPASLNSSTVSAGASAERRLYNEGADYLRALAGDRLAREAVPALVRMADGGQAVLACNAFLVLSELGPQALEPRLVGRLLDLVRTLPDRAEEIVEVALRLHAWGGAPRDALLQASISDPSGGGALLCEVLIQVFNRAPHANWRLRAVKVLAGLLGAAPASGECMLLYTNDARVLMELLLRELPNHARDPMTFIPHAKCLGNLAVRCPAARDHRREEVVAMLEDLRGDDRNPFEVRKMCCEVLTSLRPM